MVAEAESKRMVVVQQAAYTALPCLALAESEESASTTITRCGDDEESIATAFASAPQAIVFLEQEAFTASLVARLEGIASAPLKIIVRADVVTPTNLEVCVSLGCMGVVNSGLTRTALDRVLSALDAGEMWLERRWSSYVIRQLLTRQKGPKLSRREHDVLNLLRRKLKNREIAHALAISEETLRWHLRHLYAKTKRRSRGELVNYAEAINSDEFSLRMQVGR